MIIQILSKTPCSGLTVAKCLVHTEVALSFPSSAGQGLDDVMENSWVKIRMGRDHSVIIVMDRTDSAWGKLVYYQSKRGE